MSNGDDKKLLGRRRRRKGPPPKMQRCGYLEENFGSGNPLYAKSEEELRDPSAEREQRFQEAPAEDQLHEDDKNDSRT